MTLPIKVSPTGISRMLPVVSTESPSFNLVQSPKLIQTEHLYPVLILENTEGQFLDSYLNHQPLTLDTFFIIAQNYHAHTVFFQIQR